MKKQNQETKYHYNVFESGDLCRDQDGNMIVIIKVKDGVYEFIHLQRMIVNVIGDCLEIKKGSVVTQPCSIIDKYYYLYRAK